LSCSNHFAFALVAVVDLGKSCGIAAWPRQPRDKAGGDRIGGLHEHDATSSAGVFANVVGAVRGPPEVDPLLRPSIQPNGCKPNRNAARRVPLAGSPARLFISTPMRGIPSARCARCERPRGRRATKQRDELAPFDDRFPTRSVSGYRVCSA
jgi:hypothetical protein